MFMTNKDVTVPIFMKQDYFMNSNSIFDTIYGRHFDLPFLESAIPVLFYLIFTLNFHDVRVILNHCYLQGKHIRLTAGDWGCFCLCKHDKCTSVHPVTSLMSITPLACLALWPFTCLEEHQCSSLPSSSDSCRIIPITVASCFGSVFKCLRTDELLDMLELLWELFLFLSCFVWHPLQCSCSLWSRKL